MERYPFRKFKIRHEKTRKRALNVEQLRSLFAIKIEPETQVLFEKYKGKNSLLCFREQMKLHESLMKKTNDCLAGIAKKINTGELTTYVFRHTWATVAAELDIPKETISAGLGHSQGGVTDIYIRFNQKKIDAANRRIIDAVHSPETLTV